MSEQLSQENQKTVVAFVAGLLIGGLLVWVFASPKTDKMDDENVINDEETETSDTNDEDTKENATPVKELNEDVPEKAVMITGKGVISVSDQAAGGKVVIGSATFPADEGWIGVRDYQNGQLTGLLGVARFSKEQGLVPTEVELLRSTKAGSQYAVVFYSESGDRQFSLAEDAQVEGVLSTFKAK